MHFYLDIQLLTAYFKYVHKYILILVLINSVPLNQICVNAKLRFTNLKCVTHDKSFADFRYCSLKVLKRDVISLNLHVELYEVPVDNITFNLSLWKKANDYRPFLYNYTVDFCRFMANPKSKPFLNIIFATFQNDSNINHTCPYSDDIIIERHVLMEEYFRLLPLPTGDYMLNFKVGAYNQWKADVPVYFNMGPNYGA